MPKETPSWVGKHPSDMSDSELRAAKDQVATDLAPAQEKLNGLAAIVANLDVEINNRFRMGGLIPINAAPPWPDDAVTQLYGG
jgi:hypothetical protein